jgi:hypothetical protein
MTIFKDGGMFDAACDDCGEYIATNCDSFVAAVAAVKAKGGKIVKDRDERLHHCRDCKDGK